MDDINYSVGYHLASMAAFAYIRSVYNFGDEFVYDNPYEPDWIERVHIMQKDWEKYRGQIINIYPKRKQKDGR